MNNRYSGFPEADDQDLFMDDDFDDSDFDDDFWNDDYTQNAAPSGNTAPAADQSWKRSPAQDNYSFDGDFWGDDSLSGRPRRAAAPARTVQKNSSSSGALFTTSASGRRLISVPVLVLLDCVLIGCALIVFALFHHVIPRHGAPADSYVSTFDPSVFSDSSSTVSGSSVSDSSVSGSDAPAEEDLPFTDEVIVTDTSYHSSNIAVTVTTYNENNVIYHVQDIYVRSPEFFRTAFAKDTYGVWVTEETPEIAKRNNAVCAINGDYYGASSTKGIVVRNGVFYRGNGSDTDDILVLLADGSMEVYTAQTYNEEELLKKNVWQTWSFGPSLLDGNGHAIKQFDSEIAHANPRSAVGYYEPGHYCFIAVEGRSKESKGLSFVDLAALCESMGCKIAYNLDGGKTSMMTFGDRLVNDAYNGGRECSDILYICDSPAE